MYFRLAKTAVTVFAGVAALGLGSAPAALAAPADGSTEFVPCSGHALYDAVTNAGYGETLFLAPNCTYQLYDTVNVTTRLTIIGHDSTITQSSHAGGITLVSVGDCDCEAANLTLVNVNFTDGGYTDEGGAIYNDSRLTVQGGTFSGNTAEYGGAIYNNAQMTVTGATFTRNSATEGGAIYNDSSATIEGSAFTWNNATGGDNYGGAIDNEDNLYLSNTGFLANSAAYGGGIYTDDNLHASHITVTSNAASEDGGGIYNDDETAIVANSSLFGNQPDNCFDVPGCIG
jgi:predicted outer membrane repeat protein